LPAAQPSRAGFARTLLFDVQPLDPMVYAGVAALFTAVAALACLGPSLPASRIDPLRALRAVARRRPCYALPLWLMSSIHRARGSNE